MDISKRVRYALYSLFSIMLLLIVVWRILPFLSPKSAENLDEVALQKSWEAYKANNTTTAVTENSYARNNDYNNHNYENSAASNIAYNPKPFDPNTASEETLIAVGFPVRTARTLIKYRSKGGTFRKKEDVKKLYTLSEADYNKIAPYISIAKNNNGKQFEPYNAAPAKVSYSAQNTLELNIADAEQLITLRGIGPGYAKRILNFRDALGGFTSIEQLKEVWGFPDSTYQALKDHFSVNTTLVRKLNVNTATEEELSVHPYIGKKMATNIIRLRNDLKTFTEIEQLRLVPLINEEKYRKIAIYLSTH